MRLVAYCLAENLLLEAFQLPQRNRVREPTLQRDGHHRKDHGLVDFNLSGGVQVIAVPANHMEHLVRFRHFVHDVGIPFQGGTYEQVEVRLLIHGLKHTVIQSDTGTRTAV